MERTVDLLMDGLKILQPDKYPGFTVDPVMLVNNVVPTPGSIVVDLGSGGGIMPILLKGVHRKMEPFEVIGIERVPELIASSRKSLTINPSLEGVRFLEADIRQITPRSLGTMADLVISNPPYLREGSGHYSPCGVKRAMNFEGDTPAALFFEAAKRILKPGGPFTLVMRADRLEDTLAASMTSGMPAMWLRWIHSFSDRPAHLFLAAFRRSPRAGRQQKSNAVSGRPPGAGTGPEIRAPLVIYDAPGVYSSEMAGYFSPRADRDILATNRSISATVRAPSAANPQEATTSHEKKTCTP